MSLRCPVQVGPPVQSAQLPERRHMADDDEDVWRTFNTIREHMLRGKGHGEAAALSLFSFLEVAFSIAPLPGCLQEQLRPSLRQAKDPFPLRELPYQSIYILFHT